MGDCRHLHAHTFDFDMLVCMGKSQGEPAPHQRVLCPMPWMCNPHWDPGDNEVCQCTHRVLGSPGQLRVSGHTCG